MTMSPVKSGVVLPCPASTGTTIIIIPIYSVLARLFGKYYPKMLKILNKSEASRFFWEIALLKTLAAQWS